jgi:hypothetical protein
MAKLRKSPRDPNEHLVVVYEPATLAEALVVRGLLRSGGIYSPQLDTAEPFPMKEPPEGVHGNEVWVPESQLEDAQRLIYESQRAAASGPGE